MRTTIGLTLRQHRIGFLLIAGGALVTLAGVLAGVILLQVPDIRACLYVDLTAVEAMPRAEVERLSAMCGSLSEPLGILAMITAGGGLALPLIGAGVIGATLVSAEVEHTTAVLAWTLARSRRAWFLPRAAILLGLLLLSTTLVGQLLNAGVDLLASGYDPDFDAWRSLQQIYGRDLLVPARAGVVAAAALLVGAVVGRQVPALLGGGTLALLLCMGAHQLDQDINVANAVEYEGGGLWVGSAVEDQDGNRVSFQRSSEGDTIWPGDPEWEAKYHWVDLGIPDAEMPVIVWRNVAVHGAITLVLLVAATVVVERRRPA